MSGYQASVPAGGVGAAAWTAHESGGALFGAGIRGKSRGDDGGEQQEAQIESIHMFFAFTLFPDNDPLLHQHSRPREVPRYSPPQLPSPMGMGRACGGSAPPGNHAPGLRIQSFETEEDILNEFGRAHLRFFGGGSAG